MFTAWIDWVCGYKLCWSKRDTLLYNVPGTGTMYLCDCRLSPCGPHRVRREVGDSSSRGLPALLFMRGVCRAWRRRCY